MGITLLAKEFFFNNSGYFLKLRSKLLNSTKQCQVGNK